MKIKVLLTVVLVLIGASVFAEGEKQIPLLFNYQSALIDEGGNPLPDGATSVKFQLQDSGGKTVYEELQTLEVVKGTVSAIVGNGLDVNSGAPTGGISASALDPTDARYLVVEVAGHRPYDKLEIVAAPYSMWADTALKMPAGAITGDMIGKGVITKDHLNAELTAALFPNGIAKSMLPTDTAYTEDLQSSYGASKIGVSTVFVYSGSQTVQGVLKDFDTAIKKRQEEITWAEADYGTKITNEAGARSTTDSGLQVNIGNEATARTAADATLQANITTHTNSTAAHGVAGNIVGTTDYQELSNKVLVAPVIRGGTNSIPNLSADISQAANQGLVVEGNLTVTGSIALAGLLTGTSYTRITNGQYTGNGSNPRPMSTGFKAQILLLWSKDLDGGTGDYFALGMRTNQTGAAVGGVSIHSSSDGLKSYVMGVVSIDDAGFTVNNEANLNGAIYTYIALGSN